MIDYRGVLALVGVAGVLALIGYAAAKKAGVLPGPNSFNPLSPDNLAYRGANEVYRVLTGNQVDTLGTALAAGYSDRIGDEIVAPVVIVRPRPGEGIAMDDFMFPLFPPRAGIVEGEAGAAFGIYPKP